jgi:hypothetical protein
MKLNVFHLWFPALGFYALSAVMALFKEPIGAIISGVLCTALLVSTKWAHYDD